MTTPTVSVVITSHNEKHDLEVTASLAAYGSIAPKQIIVVDDASDSPPVGDRLKHIPQAMVVRNDIQRGCAASRNIGAAWATGDLIIFMDSHMRMPWWWLEAIQDAHAKHPYAIFCTSCCGFDAGWTGPTSGMDCSGARFAQDEVEVQVRWLPRTHKDIPIVPAILGACYIIPQRIWRKLGGLNPNFHGWGQDEQDLSVRAWQMGYECRCITDLAVSHRWNRSLDGYFMQDWHAQYNAVVNAATLFEDGVFEERYLPFLKQKHDDSKIWRRFYKHQHEIQAFRRRVQHLRVLSDAEVEAKAGRIIPTVDEQQHAIKHKLWTVPHSQRDALLTKEG